MECDALIVDAPYGERTHGGHDYAVADPERHARGKGYAPSDRRALNYAGWTPTDVQAFVNHWSPRTRGWMVSITSHDLAPVWAEAMEAAGRYVFPPLPWVAPGSRVRLCLLYTSPSPRD